MKFYENFEIKKKIWNFGNLGGGNEKFWTLNFEIL